MFLFLFWIFNVKKLIKVDRTGSKPWYIIVPICFFCRFLLCCLIIITPFIFLICSRLYILLSPRIFLDFGLCLFFCCVSTCVSIPLYSHHFICSAYVGPWVFTCHRFFCFLIIIFKPVSSLSFPCKSLIAISTPFTLPKSRSFFIFTLEEFVSNLASWATTAILTTMHKAPIPVNPDLSLVYLACIE